MTTFLLGKPKGPRINTSTSFGGVVAFEGPSTESEWREWVFYWQQKVYHGEVRGRQHLRRDSPKDPTKWQSLSFLGSRNGFRCLFVGFSCFISKKKGTNAEIRGTWLDLPSVDTQGCEPCPALKQWHWGREENVRRSPFMVSSHGGS